MESNEANFEHSRDVVTVDLEDDFQAAVQSSDQCCYCPTFRELHKQIDLLRYQLQQERIAREVMTAISARTDRSLAKVLADAWQAVEDEQEARQKVVDQVAALTKERDYFHSLYDLIEVQRRHEMNSAKEAHKELYAIKSQLESIQVDNENLLGQLVKVKIDYANRCMEYDDLDKKYADVVLLMMVGQTRIEELEAAMERQHRQYLFVADSDDGGFEDSPCSKSLQIS